MSLACPVCRQGVTREEHRFVCKGAECRRAYIIRDGIPLFLESESQVLSSASELKAQASTLRSKVDGYLRHVRAN